MIILTGNVPTVYFFLLPLPPTYIPSIRHDIAVYATGTAARM